MLRDIPVVDLDQYNNNLYLVEKYEKYETANWSFWPGHEEVNKRLQQKIYIKQTGQICVNKYIYICFIPAFVYFIIALP